jgi:hypothetical protein
MHVLAANNRSWHNFSDSRDSRGCNNSLFEDRIYLLQAACFPESNYGQEIRDEESGLQSCPQVCQRALTQTDLTSSMTTMSDITTPGSGNMGFYGPSLQAVPYSRERAQAICEQVLNP